MVERQDLQAELRAIAAERHAQRQAQQNVDAPPTIVAQNTPPIAAAATASAPLINDQNRSINDIPLAHNEATPWRCPLCNFENQNPTDPPTCGICRAWKCPVTFTLKSNRCNP